ncbi:hypothetical protein VC83_04650 [Pseudogymnoascus destructans]|uniref:Chromatin structure-remodeling complex protein rsc1 n=2 Tax=Pseudogymnoascus destructans TaxID=655981 RepID=L8G659_PSED2|nr:uncharacterized protein VC83_04650 [Pseudogymnoascus destructans]ELR08339.1 hypothetical protein GMDG_03134 [Pseudogymnoascus destructans 20631-21]OAF57428.1 hypothetical protein VC83_04650 [Pseudogymnoascus destructans]
MSQPPSPHEDEDAQDDNVIHNEATEATMWRSDSDGVSKRDLEIMKGIVDHLTEAKDENDREITSVFQRIVNKRFLPDYHEVIKHPVAFSTVRAKILRKQYSSWKEYVRDFAYMSHNAQVYNRPSAEAYGDALKLREMVKLELAKLVDQNIISAEDAEYPDLGEIPDVEDSPPPQPDEEMQSEDEPVEDDRDEEDEDEDEEDDVDDSDDEGARRRRRKGPRSSAAITKREGGKVEEGSKDDADAHKKRGRPPKVHTPMEARINTILKGLRKFKDEKGDLKVLHFEKPPDKTLFPEYYQEIKNPIALDMIKRKAKRKKYNSVDAVMKDLELMFDNAKEYNLEDSEVYMCAADLQRESRILAEQEKTKPDSAYVDEDGRLPLPEILHNGEIWKVGDWVHLQNPNDLTKPIVAQIYRTWQDPEGQKWINACWYYRPEQTVHRFEKHFFENEVVKTGQYRDHHIDEVVDRCFVMFFTRFNKGRPRGFPPDKEVYVCEARYNEDKFKLNKIKTWASCVPDEVREKDYEMDLFNVPRKMKKVPSPIKHLLREDAKEDDPLPKPTWGAANAPPIVGAVHKRPREANESPPPEPTPSPPPPRPVEPVRRSITTERATTYGQSDTPMGNMQNTAPSPAPAQQTLNSYGQQSSAVRPSASPAPQLHQQSSYASYATVDVPPPQTPSFAPSTTHNNHAITHAPPSTIHASALQHPGTPNPLANYDSGYARSVPQPRNYAAPPAGSHANAYNPPRSVEVYHLSDVANASIPQDIRSQFHRDENDRVLFFTAPPLDVPRVPAKARVLGHSLKYLAAKLKDTDALAEARKERDKKLAEMSSEKRKRDDEEFAKREEEVEQAKIRALQAFNRDMEEGTLRIYERIFGADGKAVMEEERLTLEKVHAKQKLKNEESAKREREYEESQKARIYR